MTWHNTGVWARTVSYTAGIGDEHFVSAADTAYEIMGAPAAYSPASREFLVVWRSPGAPFNIEGRRLGVTGAPIAPPFAIAAGAEFRNNPSIAYNPRADEYLVVYSAGYPGPRATAQRVSAGTGALVGAPSTLGQAVDIFTTGVAYNPASGQYLAAWYQGPGNAIFGRVVGAAGEPVGDVTVLSTRFGTYDSLSLSANPVSGTVLLAGHDKMSTESGGVEITAAGVPTSSGVQFTAAGGTGNFYPRLGSHSSRAEWLLVTSNSFSRTVAQRLGSSSSGGGGVTPPPPAQLTVSVAPSVALPVPEGTPITWTGTAAGGTGPHQFKFLRWSAGGSWLVAQDWGAKNTYTWFPSTGTHAIQVWVRNAGSTTAYDAYAGSGEFQVIAPAARLSSFAADRSFPLAFNTPVTFTAQAWAGSAGVEYRFLRYSAGTGWIVARDYSTSNSYTWFPPLGTNAVQVWVRVIGSGVAYQDYRSSGWFNIVSAAAGVPKLTALSADVPLPMSPMAQATWTATATGGTGPLEYKFFLYNSTTKAWTVFRDWSASNQAVQPVPGVSGTGLHAVQVWVRTAGSGVLYEDWRSTDLFNITHIASVTLTPNVPLGSIAAGQVVTFTASVNGGSGPWEFAFSTFNGSNWVQVQPYIANANSLTTTFPAGTKGVHVWVRSAGSTTAYESWATLSPFTVR